MSFEAIEHETKKHIDYYRVGRMYLLPDEVLTQVLLCCYHQGKVDGGEIVGQLVTDAMSQSVRGK